MPDSGHFWLASNARETLVRFPDDEQTVWFFVCSCALGTTYMKREYLLVLRVRVRVRARVHVRVRARVRARVRVRVVCARACACTCGCVCGVH